MQISNITVIKANGKKEPFSEQKVFRSLNRANVPAKYHHAILEELQHTLRDNMTTRDIYANIRGYFHREFPAGFAKYNLKMAIMELGPSGYPFERYTGELLKHYGYTVKVGQILQGKCVAHEVDVIAEKNSNHYIIECKFHNQPGTRSDVKVALYVKARYEDIYDRLKLSEPETLLHTNHQVWLITNTKCTADAIQYAQCAGVKIISWSYPDKGNLQDMVEEAGLYPITVFSSLSQSQKEYVLQKNIVLAKELAERPDIIQELHLAQEAEFRLKNEFQSLFADSQVHESANEAAYTATLAQDQTDSNTPFSTSSF